MTMKENRIIRHRTGDGSCAGFGEYANTPGDTARGVCNKNKGRSIPIKSV